MEREAEVETPFLKISSTELIKNLNANKYRENPEVLQNLKIKSTDFEDIHIEFEEILTLLQARGLSSIIKSLDVSYNLSYNLLKKLPSNMHTLNQLTSLDVAGNELTTLSAIAPLTTLTSLDASNNKLEMLAGIEYCTALIWLDIHGNKELPRLTGVEQLTVLASLNVSGNRLITFAGIEHCTALTSLDLSMSNQLVTKATTLTKIVDIIKQLPLLSWLRLVSNNLTTLAGIEPLKALTFLSINLNKLTNLEHIMDFKALTSLLVSFNKLIALTGIETLTALRQLDINYNQLTRLPITLGSCAALEPFDVDHNPLPASAPKTIAELKVQFLRLQQAYQRISEITDLVNDNVQILSPAVNQIIVEYVNDIEPSVRQELSNLPKEELAALKETISTPHTKDKDMKIQKKANDLKVITSLHEAIKDNNIKAFEKLLSEAQNLSIILNSKIGDANDTLLHAAAFSHIPEFTRLLLANGANPNQANRNSYTPVATAAVRGNHNILAVYQQHVAPAGQAFFVPINPETWKMAAIKCENIKNENPNGEINYKEVRDIFEAVLQNLGIVLEQPTNRNIEVQLQLLSYIHHKDAMNLKRLLAENPRIDLNVIVEGTRLLHEATQQNDEAIVQLLLESGASPKKTIVDSKGQAITPVHIAADKNLVNLLKLYREDINLMKKNRDKMEKIWTDALRIAEIKRTSTLKNLFSAICRNQFEAFKDILSKNPGLDVNATDPENASLLHAASKRGVPTEFAKQLLEIGANPNTKGALAKALTARVLTPVDVAAIEGRADLIELYMASEISIPVEENTWQRVRFGGPYALVNTGPDANYLEANSLIKSAWISISTQGTINSSPAPVIIHAPSEKPKR